MNRKKMEALKNGMEFGSITDLNEFHGHPLKGIIT